MRLGLGFCFLFQLFLFDFLLSGFLSPATILVGSGGC